MYFPVSVPFTDKLQVFYLYESVGVKSRLCSFPKSCCWGDHTEGLWGAGTVPPPTPDLISTTSPLSQGMRMPVHLNNTTRYFILPPGCSDPSQNQEGKVHNLVNTHLLCVSVYTCVNRGQKLMLGTFFFNPLYFF